MFDYWEVYDGCHDDYILWKSCVVGGCIGGDTFDYGCGDGAMWELLGKPSRYAGYDVSPIAVRRFTGRGGIFEKPYRFGHYDTVLCLDVLEHTSDTYMEMDRVISLAKSGGAVVISLPNAYHLINRVLWLFGINIDITDCYGMHGLLSEHIQRFNLKSAKEFIGDRLDIERTVYYGGSGRRNIFNRMLVKYFPSVFAYSFVFICRRNCV
jgi:hypothetical protein